MWRISADTGGTFTDCFALDPAGRQVRCKVLSSGCLRARVVTKSSRMVGVEGLGAVDPKVLVGWRCRRVGEAGNGIRVTVAESADGVLVFELESAAFDVGELIELHTGEEAPVLGVRLLTGTAPGADFPPMRMRLATTRATNALLEGKGAPTALFVTEGFRDLLVIGDQRRSDLFALSHAPRAVFAKTVVEVRERLAVDGTVLLDLDEAALRVAASDVVESGVRHAAVTLLHGYAHPQHERRVAEILVTAGFDHVSISSDIAPFAKLLIRAQSTVANATLTGPVDAFVRGVSEPLKAAMAGAPLQMLTSAGGLESAATIRPKDLLLSGPAGGAMGAATAAEQMGCAKVLTLDMGGTSTDVARIDGRPGYRFVQKVGGMELMAPCVAIETVAAGGGSICAWTPLGLRVGPESAGSDPGPACYGKGGPLTITDVNVLLGRFDPALAPIPLDVNAARFRAEELRSAMGESMTLEALLNGLLGLAVEQMADAMRRISVAEGFDPAEYGLLAFGGAGPQHACDVAMRLGMKTVLAPRQAGILSAVGLDGAQPERFAQRQTVARVDEMQSQLPEFVRELSAEASMALGDAASEVTQLVLIEMRLRGQDQPLQVVWQSGDDLTQLYRTAYERLFGYAPSAERVIEVVSVRVSVRASGEAAAKSMPQDWLPIPGMEDQKKQRLIQDAFSTLVVLPGWKVESLGDVGYRLRWEGVASVTADAGGLELLQRDLLRHRLHSLVDEMGALLCRTAISTNIRERLDFSCAVLDAEGRLISSAPHIPVHLGALGVCVREAVRGFELGEGDTLITNHPAFGGSHLPDITLITPVFSADGGALLGYVANRAHHAEIGGMAPGSMPPDAKCLEEEGVVISPRYLVRSGQSCFDELAELFSQGKFPTRSLSDNLADLHAQLAANRQGVVRLRDLAEDAGESWAPRLKDILDHSASVMRSALQRIPEASQAEQKLDDGSVIAVNLKRDGDGLVIDFCGTSGVHPGNLNATTAIVRSAVLYALRVWLAQDLPLNEGLLAPVNLVCPEGMLNPKFTGDAVRDPAVVGGNVEVSQRLVDTLFLALGVQACSQGTMNNLLFGNDRFGYYETVAGGAGAGDGYAGASALHTHMTNTAITDAEILEMRFPVRLWRFAVRGGSGGEGCWAGGDGVVREFEFLTPLTVSMLTQHRIEVPYGMNGGGPGCCGEQWLQRFAGGAPERLPASVRVAVQSGDRLTLMTPGGGGYGQAKMDSMT
ncbi:MAG: hydantoinase B/oxoprolinase family protein [Verrucomicrobiaceae bacterium]|nr:hydantoinase B/oxoprolinase family protein [Verrucomicrobiaceae bacterium]